MVGKRIVRLVKNMAGERVAGEVGQIIGSDQHPTYNGHEYQYFVTVQWQDREGNLSRPWKYSKEQLNSHTRPLRIQEIAAIEPKQTEPKRALPSQLIQIRNHDRGLSM